MKRLLLGILLLLNVSVAVKAQDSTKKIQVKVNNDIDRFPLDPSAHAFFMEEYGNASVRRAGDGGLRIYYFYRGRVKIVDEEGFKYGTIEVPVSGGEFVYAITGSTTYKDQNGKYFREFLGQDKIYKLQRNRYQSLIKFALPALKPGCIVEYTYTVVSPYFSNFHSWQFESDIPKISSEFQSSIPSFLTYNISLRGALNPNKNVSSVLKKSFAAADDKFDIKQNGVAMYNIPAFVKEDYMTAPKNFTSALYYELSQFINPNTGGVHKIADQWTDIEKTLKEDDYFGDQIKPRGYLKDKAATVTAGKKDTLDKAKAIYAYVQKNIKWNEAYGISSADIRKALEKHAGGSGDINLALVAALRAGGVNADPVLISTRDHGVPNKIYPVITDFDYVIVKTDIGGKSYLLDATDALLGFGMLPLRCLNDQGRVMATDKPSYWVDIAPPQNESRTYTLNLKLQNDGKLKGTFINYYKGYAAYLMRKVIKGFNTPDEYVERLDDKLTKLKILKSEITDLDSLNSPLSETYEVEINAFENSTDNRFSFSPYLFDKIAVNPFKLQERIYPVDWGMPSETKIIMQVQMPESYTVENPPENVTLAIPNNGGNFIVKYDPGINSFTFSHIISFKKSIYPTEEYLSLKELYNKIIQTEKTEMVFKKKI